MRSGAVKNNTHSIFLSSKQNYKDLYSFNLGLRYNYVSSINRHFFEPRFSLIYKPLDALSFRLNGGLYQQYSSQIRDLNNLGINNSLWAFANNDDIGIINSGQLSFGFLYNSANLSIDAEVYYKILSGITALDLAYGNISSAPLTTGDVVSRGFDFMINRKIGKYNTWISYTLNRTNFKFEELNRGNSFSAPHDQRHLVSWVHEMTMGKWQWSLSWKYATGLPYTEVLGIDKFTDPMGKPTQFYLLYDKMNEGRLPAYHRLDMSLKYRFYGKDNDLNGSLTLSALNLYDRSNVLARKYYIELHDDKPITTASLIQFDRFLLGLTPNLSFRLNW